MRRLPGARAALAAALLSCACGRGRDPRVRSGDTVVVRYELSTDGAVVESDFDGEPATVVQGAGQLPPGADAALLGMKAGEEKRLVLAPDMAFGPRDPARVESMPLARLGGLAKGLEPGNKVMGFRDGKPETARVLSVAHGAASLDFNPPLAGKTVGYRLRVVSVEVGP